MEPTLSHQVEGEFSKEGLLFLLKMHYFGHCL